MRELTEKQIKILEFINIFVSSSGSAPTVREIAAHFGITIGPVQRHLKALVAKGYVRHRAGTARGLDPASRRPLARVPVLGSVPAGAPVTPLEDAGEYVYVESDAVRHGEHFALRVKGESMTGAGILEGDVVVVKCQPDAEHDDIVVAMIDNEATVKKLHRRGEDVCLKPANPAYQPIYSDDITIVGKVVYLVRNYEDR